MFLLILRKWHFLVYASYDKSIKLFEIESDEKYAIILVGHLKSAYFLGLFPYIEKKLAVD